MTPPPPARRARSKRSRGTFLARFFDNDLTGGSTDLRHSFLWLLAAIALPGIFVPHHRIGVWMGILYKRGPEALSMESALDKIFSLGLTMVIVAFLAAIVWQSLLIDRRDVLVLGSFPVRHRTVLAGKFGALAGFFGVIWIAMHAAGAVFYGLYLGGQTGLLSALRTLVAHFVTSGAAGLFMYLAVIALQGLLLGVAGPRLFARLAPVLQVAMITGALLLFAMLPWTAQAAPGLLDDRPARTMPPGLFFWMPPVWFVGLYDTILGIGNARVHTLALQALAALGGVASLAFISYPLAYRRVVTDALIGSPIPARRGIARRLIAHLPTVLARNPICQATLQFAFSTIGRSSLHRLIIAASVGIGTAFVVPLIAVNLDAPLPAPTPGLLSLPIVVMLLLLAGMRVGISLPAELPAAWIFSASLPAESKWFAIAARRLLWITALVPPLAIMTVSYYAIWGPRIAGLHLLLVFSGRAAHDRTAPLRIQWRRLRQGLHPWRGKTTGAMAALSPRHRDADHSRAAGRSHAVEHPVGRANPGGVSRVSSARRALLGRSPARDRVLVAAAG